ncbi:hypothetical protein AAG906_031813 [Vitis piasezkii]
MAGKLIPMLSTLFFFFSIMLNFPEYTTSDNACSYPSCLSPPPPATQTASSSYPPPQYYSPPAGYLPYYPHHRMVPYMPRHPLTLSYLIFPTTTDIPFMASLQPLLFQVQRW